MRLSELLEGRDAPLYHGTTLVSALGIVKHGVIDGNQHYDHHPVGVSLTREYVVALNFGRAWERQFPVVFVFDQNAIVRSNLKLFPRRDSSEPGVYRDRTEAEEMVLGDLPLEPYLLSINIPESEIARALGPQGKQYVGYLKDEGFPDMTNRKWMSGVRKLLTHPKLNKMVPAIDASYRARQDRDQGYWQLGENSSEF